MADGERLWRKEAVRELQQATVCIDALDDADLTPCPTQPPPSEVPGARAQSQCAQDDVAKEGLRLALLDTE